jgi:glycolate oxidase iron-sulfur subunit
LIKDMLEKGRTPDERTVEHIDRCLGCLSCMSTCPSGVHYMHLIDHAREYIEHHFKRRWNDKALRWLLSKVLPYPNRFRIALIGARLLRPFRNLLPDARIRAMLEMAPSRIQRPSKNDRPQTFLAQSSRRYRVALLTGCAQRALNADINEATIRLLRRHGCDVVIPTGVGCCGALSHHMGKSHESLEFAAANIRALVREITGEGLDAIVINTSGCGTTIKDYGHIFRDHALAAEAARVATLARDVSELMLDIGLLDARHARPLRVGYHSACSLQHGQQIRLEPKALLGAAGFTVLEPKDSHLCCGSAGTYNLLQPGISAELKKRKVAALEITKPDVICAGNIGCMMQIASSSLVPVVHTVELLDWATGGPTPRSLIVPHRAT